MLCKKYISIIYNYACSKDNTKIINISKQYICDDFNSYYIQDNQYNKFKEYLQGSIDYDHVSGINLSRMIMLDSKQI